MAYIRINGIVREVLTANGHLGGDYFVDRDGHRNFVRYSKGGRVSDRIADLFDAVVMVSEDGESHQTYESEDDFLSKTALGYANLEYGCRIYGAIWTEWGLEYVAECATKGWELI